MLPPAPVTRIDLPPRKCLQPLFVEIDLGAFTAKQIANLHVAQIADTHLSHEQFVESWRDLHVRRKLAAQLHDFVQLPSGNRRDGDDDLIDVSVSARDFRQHAASTEDFKPVDAHVRSAGSSSMKPSMLFVPG